MFEIGDRVKVLDGSGHVGVIRAFMPGKASTVLVDGFSGGHDGSDRLESGDCQWVWAEILEKAD